jgi:hypothetical protein
MSRATPVSPPYDEARSPPGLGITDGEVNFLWSFIQGSIMLPETWHALMHGYGFCERHAWVHISVEMAFRKRHFLGPVILYNALIEKLAAALAEPHRPFALHSPQHRLQAGGPCLLCALHIAEAGPGACPEGRLARGRDSRALTAFAGELAAFWRPTLCTICADKPGRWPARCRAHLADDLQRGVPVDLSMHRLALQDISTRLGIYEKSFLAGGAPPSDQERAALISAIGWCSGWRPLLGLLDDCD